MEQKSATGQKTRKTPQQGTAGSPETGPGEAIQTSDLNQGDGGNGVIDQAKQTVSQVASRAGNTVSSRLDAQKERAVEGLDGLVQAVRQTVDQLRQQDQNAAIPQYLNSAVTQVERMSGYLRSTDIRQMVREVEQYARRQPAIFLGGAFALGLLGARFLKSSNPQTATTQPLGSTASSSSLPSNPGGRQTGWQEGGSRGMSLTTPSDTTTRGVGEGS